MTERKPELWVGLVRSVPGGLNRHHRAILPATPPADPSVPTLLQHPELVERRKKLKARLAELEYKVTNRGNRNLADRSQFFPSSITTDSPPTRGTAPQAATKDVESRKRGSHNVAPLEVQTVKQTCALVLSLIVSSAPPTCLCVFAC